MKQILNSLGFNDIWHEVKLDDYTNDSKALAVVKAYLAQYNKSTTFGLFLYGANGVGKSYLANALCMQLIKQKVGCVSTTFTDLCTLYVEKWSNPDAGVKFNTALKSKVLLIEEIGKEYNTSKEANNNFINTCLDDIIKYRVQNFLPTHFTSNLSPMDLKVKYTKDIASLLKEASIIVNVVGNDYRDVIMKSNRDKIKL